MERVRTVVNRRVHTRFPSTIIRFVFINAQIHTISPFFPTKTALLKVEIQSRLQRRDTFETEFMWTGPVLDVEREKD